MNLPLAVIDTNVLIASLSKKNITFGIYEAFIDKKFKWLISTEILNEYEEQLADFYNYDTAKLVIEILLTGGNTVLYNPYFKWRIITEDPDDNKFSDLALAG